MVGCFQGAGTLNCVAVACICRSSNSIHLQPMVTSRRDTCAPLVSRLPFCPRLDLFCSVYINFTSDTDGVMDYFQVSWEGHGISTSMPPQFIMMIAASSAAAGAMLLFLCLWHCVFRPVQMRRQQVAAAMAAAASAAVNAAGNAPGGRGGNRNRVPRRYLRMMTTSVYSVKDAAAAVTASTQAAAASVTSKDALKVCTSGGAAKDDDTTSAVAELPGQHHQQGTPEAARERKALERPTSATPDKPQPAPVAVVVVTGAVPTVGSMTSLPPPPSSSGPGSHSEPEASGGEVCSICLSEFEDGERVKHLPCKHFYHVACIDQWLGRDITCPLCKDNVLDALKSLFGRLPARGGNARQGRVGDEDTVAVGAGTTVAAAPAPAVPGGEDIGGIGGGDGRAISGGGAAANGGDLEMVLILPYDPAAPGGNGSSGGGVLTELPGSVTTGNAATGRHSADHGFPLPDTAAVINRAGSSLSSMHAGVMASTAAAGAVAMAAGPAGPVSSSNSRELRPMRRNISADLTADQDGTSSDCDSGDDSEYGTASHHPRHGSRVAAAAVTATAAANTTARTRGFRSVQAPPPMPLGSGGEVAASRGNQFALPVLIQSGSAAAASAVGSSYFETAGLAPSPRPVVEHVQRSPYSSSSAHSTGMRWMPSQAAPRLAAALVGGPTLHRLARAQEAQMAVAAAALSAAAAGISSGGISSGAGGSGAGTVGINSWRVASSTSVCGSAPPPIQCFDGAVSGTESVLPYRVHNNPLAVDSAGSRSEADSPRLTDAAFAPAFSVDQLLGIARPTATVNPAASASQRRTTVPPAPHAMSVLSSSHVRNQGTSDGGRPRRPSSAGIPNMQRRAVPEVSASCDDIIRVATSANPPQQQPHGRTTVMGLWGSAGLL
ncbi:hypothetical protein Vafri_4840 [Volvox africanus]|uniref:RING-type domain-containing protein n=1 Tax=Volvox africanus TaxID=51714 RepID=A0A8J4AVS1_9CHLO|nr:hypothetical protein Vafri_4840 [Volvox africanus]